MNRAVTPPPIPPSSRPGGVGGAKPAGRTGTLSSNIRITPANTQTPTLAQAVDAENLETSGSTIALRALKKREKGEEIETHEHAEIAQEKTELIEEVQGVEDEAKEMAKRNQEFKAPTLVELFKSLRPTDEPADILRKIQNLYRDPYLADEALAFLGRVTADTDLKVKITAARNILNRGYEREITAGRNIRGPIEVFTRKHPKVKQKPDALRDLYRAITGKNHTATDLFNHFFSKFPFDHLVFIFGFLFDALGADLNSQGPSISPAKLKKLVKDVRKIQAIFGVYRYFKGSERLLKAEFARYHIPYPQAGNFEKK